MMRLLLLLNPVIGIHSTSQRRCSRLCMILTLLILVLPAILAWQATTTTTTITQRRVVLLDDNRTKRRLALNNASPAGFDEAKNAATGLLYQDMQKARARAALVEGELLQDRITEFEAPYSTTLEGAATSPKPKALKTKISSGTGFNSPTSTKKKKKTKSYFKMTPKEKQTLHRAATLQRDGCLRINGALRKTTATRVGACILKEIQNAADALEQNPTNIVEIHAQHGIDQERENRCVINLPLRADKIKGYERACREADPTFERGVSEDPILQALEELLDEESGALGPLYRELCGEEAPLYELCSLVTWPGSLRQSVHPDAAHQPNAPLYAAFVACQDITVHMGPTLFLPGTHLPTEERALFDNVQTRNDMIRQFQTPKTATLKQGDLAIFDMRCLHVGTANDPEKGSTRILFNLTFRNPKADQPIGYDGSIRKHYLNEFTLAAVQKELKRGPQAFAEVA